ncbi:MAG TPA: DUF6585 family protein [Allocoleopsis sp.]
MGNNQFDRSGQLGCVLGEFGWNKGRAKALLIAWILVFFISLPALFMGAPLLSIYIIYRSFKRLKGTKPVISLYQQGLIDCRKRTPKIIFYEDIKKLLLSVTSTNGILNYLITLETQNLGKIKIDEHVANVDRLRALLEEQFIQIQLPALIANYQQGNAIKFGQLTITQEGLLAGKRVLPWSEFKSVDVKRSYNSVLLLIYQKNSKKEWCCFSRDYFPNLALFFAFINYMTATQGQANMS